MFNLKPFLYISVTLITCVFGTQVATANTGIDYNSVDVGSLQNQYQSQLKPKTPKAPAVKRPAKRAQINAAELRQYQNLLLGNQAPKKAPARRQVVKKPVQQVQRRAPQRQVQARVQRQVAPAPRRPAAPAPRRDAIFEAASSGNVRLIGQLLTQGVNVNQANNQRETALHMAAAKGHYSAVIYLLNNGANIHSRTVSNWLPIHHATRFRHAQIANFLKQRGSSIYAKTSDGFSAVDMARSMNDRRILGIFGVR